MNVMAAARTLNQKAAQQKWHHFCDPMLAFHDPFYLQFLSLWKAKAGERAMPTRAEMTPRDLKDFLRHIVVFQRNASNPSRYSWRVIGTGLGREYLDAEHLYVPLANDKDEPTYIMGLCRFTPRRSEAEETWESQIAAVPGALV
jgi:hypothetical protein